MAKPLAEPADTQPRPWPRGVWPKLWGMLRLKCPRCCQGSLFRGWFTMNDPCPTCGLVLQREPGYFLGAMYVSYGIASVLLIGGFFLAGAFLPGWSDYALLGLVVLFYLPLVPKVFQYSRACWIYFERAGSSDRIADAYETAREREAQRDTASVSPPDSQRPQLPQ
jgi:uncharacterized protein (DUF983 family)